MLTLFVFRISMEKLAIPKKANDLAPLVWILLLANAKMGQTTYIRISKGKCELKISQRNLPLSLNKEKLYENSARRFSPFKRLSDSCYDRRTS